MQKQGEFFFSSRLLPLSTIIVVHTFCTLGASARFHHLSARVQRFLKTGIEHNAMVGRIKRSLKTIDEALKKRGTGRARPGDENSRY